MKYYNYENNNSWSNGVSMRGLSERESNLSDTAASKTVDFLEDVYIIKMIEERDKNDDGTRYTSEDVIRMRNERLNYKIGKLSCNLFILYNIKLLRNILFY